MHIIIIDFYASAFSGKMYCHYHDGRWAGGWAVCMMGTGGMQEISLFLVQSDSESILYYVALISCPGKNNNTESGIFKIHPNDKPFNCQFSVE